MTRAMVAGFGNLLRGDDGFGVQVVKRLQESGEMNGVELLDVGTGGLRLAQQLLDGYDRLIVVDAMDRGAKPGTIFVLRVDEVLPANAVDAHLAVPAQALGVARALGVLPSEVYMVGFQPVIETTEELTTEMSSQAVAAVEEAARQIRALLAAPRAAGSSG